MNLDIFKICTFFAFEAKLLEIEPEDTIPFFYIMFKFFNSKEICKMKTIGHLFSEIEISQLEPLSLERYESVNKYNVLINTRIIDGKRIFVPFKYRCSQQSVGCTLLVLFGTE